MTRIKEQGGITILVALSLVVVMGAMAFTLNREVLRELTITGNESVGRKASEAATSGIDWTITWAYSNGTSTDQAAIRNAFLTLVDSIDRVELREVGVDATPSVRGTKNTSPTGYQRIYLYHDTSSSDLLLPKTGYTQDTVVQQAFDLEIRYLGSVPVSTSGAITQLKDQQAANKRYYFLIRSMGRADIQGTGQAFVAQRDAIAEYIPGSL